MVLRSLRERTRRYRELLLLLNTDYFIADARLLPRLRKRSDRRAAGPRAALQRHLDALLRDWAMADFADGKDLPLRPQRGESGGMYIASSKTRSSVVTFVIDLYRELNRRKRLDRLVEREPSLFHYSLRHRVLPDWTPDIAVWRAVDRLAERLKRLVRFIIRRNWVLGGYARIEADRCMVDGKPCVTLHAHLVVERVPGTTPTIAMESHWRRSARRKESSEILKSRDHDGSPATRDALLNLIQYAGGSTGRFGCRVPKLLMGFASFKLGPSLRHAVARERQQRKNGLWTKNTLRVRLLVDCHPRYEQGFFGTWSARGRQRGKKIASSAQNTTSDIYPQKERPRPLS
jgi:hypothetical protein